jgi:hypothetical protein
LLAEFDNANIIRNRVAVIVGMVGPRFRVKLTIGGISLKAIQPKSDSNRSNQRIFEAMGRRL